MVESAPRSFAGATLSSSVISKSFVADQPWIGTRNLIDTKSPLSHAKGDVLSTSSELGTAPYVDEIILNVSES